MPNSADILWFKTQFQSDIEPALAGGPLTVDFITALACHETGEIWPVLRKQALSTDQILALCVGDTLDADKGRSAFPTTKTDLLTQARGDEMFDIAYQALVDMAVHIPAYRPAAQRPNKFCHGFGLFQLDLQFFRDDPDYFLNQDYERFDATFAKCLRELQGALATLGFDDRASLTDIELAAVGIVYNTGGFKPQKGLRQGHFDGTRFYGEALFDFIRLAHTVALPGAAPDLLPPAAGTAILPPPTPVTATGAFFQVKTLEGMLRLRSEPSISTPAQANVIAHLPDGHPVRAVTGTAANIFLEVETSLAGARLRGFASKRFLVPDAATTGIPVVVPAQALPASGIVAVSMPRKPGRVTKRSDEATAYSLNEAGQPSRVGATAEALRTELNAVIDWLAADAPAHLRYQARAGLTFCNIYCHDVCHLAGAYLPRVWWSSTALIALAQGRAVQALIGDTIREMRANDLFRWLREFGPAFGWRQTGTLSALQQAANQGALGLIVARRKEDGRSGHIVVVAPETDAQPARRNAAGEVTAPLQSQAGTTNFRRSTGKANWWRAEQFAESAFWVHARAVTRGLVQRAVRSPGCFAKAVEQGPFRAAVGGLGYALRFKRNSMSISQSAAARCSVALFSTPSSSISNGLASLPVRSARSCLKFRSRSSATGRSSAFMKPYSSVTFGFSSAAARSSSTAMP